MDLFDRKYLLQIGDADTGDGLSITDLQLTFSARKSVNNKDKIDRCSITVYNLSDISLTYLETEYATAVFSCGYESQDNVVRLFQGQITGVETRKQGADRVTKFEVTPAYSDLTFKVMSELVPENGVVEDVIEVIRKQTALARGAYRGAGLSRRIIYGYPLSGTPREMLNKVCSIYKLQWRIDGETLFINDFSTVESEFIDTAPVISPTTGLIEKPYPFKGADNKSNKDAERTSGIKFTSLINANVVPGTLVRVDYAETSEYLRVEEVDFSGDFRGKNWYMICTCSRRQKTQ
jgi:hypothetical protein